MNKFFVFIFVSLVSLAVSASWYWPFGGDEKAPPRLSELMEPVSLLIEEASDLAADGKTAESVQKYREALAKLDEVEAKNPDRVDKPEFATVKTKRAYIEAAIDTMLFSQAHANAKPVAVSDTTELEKRLAAERNPAQETRPPAAAKPAAAKPAAAKPAAAPLRTRRDQVVRALAESDFATADRLIGEWLEEKPNNPAALNLRAAREMAAGDLKKAEHTLDQAIQSNPRDYYAFYNMAHLMLQANPANKSGARRYYKAARDFGCPADAQLEEAFK